VIAATSTESGKGMIEMKNNGSASFFAVAIVLVVAGLFLRWDLVDWLIDAVGLLFIVVGIAAGAFAAVKTMSSRKRGQVSL